jgi:hypothetical protein
MQIESMSITLIELSKHLRKNRNSDKEKLNVADMPREKPLQQQLPAVRTADRCAPLIVNTVRQGHVQT